MKGKIRDGNDSYYSNHFLHHRIDFKERPLKNENTQTSTCVLVWMFSDH